MKHKLAPHLAIAVFTMIALFGLLANNVQAEENQAICTIGLLFNGQGNNTVIGEIRAAGAPADYEATAFKLDGTALQSWTGSLVAYGYDEIEIPAEARYVEMDQVGPGSEGGPCRYTEVPATWHHEDGDFNWRIDTTYAYTETFSTFAHETPEMVMPVGELLTVTLTITPTNRAYGFFTGFHEQSNVNTQLEFVSHNCINASIQVDETHRCTWYPEDIVVGQPVEAEFVVKLNGNANPIEHLTWNLWNGRPQPLGDPNPNPGDARSINILPDPGEPLAVSMNLITTESSIRSGDVFGFFAALVALTGILTMTKKR